MDWGCLPGVGVWLGGGALDEKGDLCPGLWSLGIPKFHSCLVGPVGTISQLNPLAPPRTPGQTLSGLGSQLPLARNAGPLLSAIGLSSLRAGTMRESAFYPQGT